MSTIEQQNARINDGQISDAILRASMPTFLELRENVISQIKISFRDGTHSYEKLLSYAGQLCLLDDFENKLLSKVRRGQNTLKEIHDAR